MRSLILLLGLLFAGALAADEVADDELPPPAVFTGFYLFHDDRSEFKPLHGKDKPKQYWWLSGNIDRLKRIYLTADKQPTGHTQPVYVTVRGVLIEGGRHGYHGNYNTELKVDEILELKRMDPGEQTKF